MKIDDIKKCVQSSEYDFLRKEPLGDNIILLGLGGSHAYGTDNENSDIDIRGIALNSKREVLLNTDFEQVVDVTTDTTVYSLNKMIELLTKLNPNTCELLGLEDWQYLHVHPIGQKLIDNSDMFLSKLCIHTFGGYANAQLRRLENKAARLVGQAENEKHILKSIQNAEFEYKNRYFPYLDGQIKLYTDTAVQEGYDSEIFMDIDLKHYPLRDWAGMWVEHDLLMDIRNGKYLDSERQPIPEFFEMLNEYEKRMQYAVENTSLPDKPDYKRIEEFKMSVNEQIVRGDYDEL